MQIVTGGYIVLRKILKITCFSWVVFKVGRSVVRKAYQDNGVKFE